MARRRSRDPRALGGVLFVALFISGLVLGGALSSAPFPMPGASAQEVARYYDENRTAVLAAGSLQVLSSLALLVFSSSVTAFVRRTAGGRGALPALTTGGGGQTRLIIAHRVATAARTDLVAWLDRGKLRSLGPHTDLWRDPEYRALFGTEAVPTESLGRPKTQDLPAVSAAAR